MDDEQSNGHGHDNDHHDYHVVDQINTKQHAQSDDDNQLDGHDEEEEEEEDEEEDDKDQEGYGIEEEQQEDKMDEQQEVVGGEQQGDEMEGKDQVEEGWKIVEIDDKEVKVMERPKRPKSAYMLFARKHQARVLAENEGMKMTESLKVLSAMWKEVGEEEKKELEEEAAKQKEEQKVKMDKYKEWLKAHPEVEKWLKSQEKEAGIPFSLVKKLMFKSLDVQDKMLDKLGPSNHNCSTRSNKKKAKSSKKRKQSAEKKDENEKKKSKRIVGQATQLMIKAVELFIEHIGEQASRTIGQKQTIDYAALYNVVMHGRKLEFLNEDLPKPEPKSQSSAATNAKRVAAAKPTEPAVPKPATDFQQYFQKE